jgi:oxygen-independent coproporphyrinogen-3 oxidase
VEYAYVHIPFCSGICGFCSYFLTVKRGAGSDGQVDAYLSQLIAQLRIHLQDLDLAISYIYLGGGTPSVLRSSQLARLLEDMVELDTFAPSLIGTMEIHPELFDDLAELDRVLDVLAAHGIGRVSIGYQSKDGELLHATNRRHGTEFLSAAAEHLRARGFIFNVDLMYGLPNQSLASWVDTIASVLAIRPNSISTYFTFVDYGTQLWHDVQREPALLSTPEHTQLCHITAQLALEDAGYHELPNDFYTMPAADDTAFEQTILPSAANSLALGAGAYGYYPGVQYFNEFSFIGYARAVTNGREPIWRAAVLTPAEELCRDVMFSFKNSPKLDLRLFQQRHGLSPLDSHPCQFEELVRLDLVDMSADAVWLTPKGRLLVEEISCMFAPERPAGAVASRSEVFLVRKHNYVPTYSRTG